MNNNKLKKLKTERDLIEKLLRKEMERNDDAKTVYKKLEPYFAQIDSMQTYKPLGRIKLERLFLESDLSNNKELFNCYGRFANLVEGIFI